MGKITVTTREQNLLLEEFKKDPVMQANFYFTGGTALSLYYLQHRKSVDLDFFSQKSFDPLLISERINIWAKKLKFEVAYTPREIVHPFFLTFKNKKTVKIDFSFYPHPQLKKNNNFDGINVDNIFDIAVNKLLVVEQRTEVKDFVDLFFLLKNHSIWDLMAGVGVKFGIKLDPFIISSDFYKVDLFEYLPQMIKPLTLKDMKEFFWEKATQLGRKSTKT